ncbi:MULTISPECIES: FAD-dependent oxidoreductase [Nitrosopumilus]|uniref:Protoporphyrinogen oxidase n=1 Tax=Nitrosopumilus piranensis TaxID=1582439 RepID=A0A0C5CB18_9ARCH|nr:MULTISPECIES: FAD-dependent oxidoreductase [Nitrosopumilus]AJM92387.1 Protoporphyrinogen oxidase [Nitrosopumilus piranensis]KAF6244306.1 protoporphyrinogen oxidase [Nitrosopumilus sp. b2]
MKSSVIVIGAGVGGLTTGALLAKEGYSVHILEKSSKLGGRTASLVYKNHILDNGFHIMPFYKKSAIFSVLKKIGIDSRLKLATVNNIAFHSDSGFHKYPKGMLDLLQLSLIPLKSRIRLLKLLLPMAFTSIEKTEEWDEKSLTDITEKLDSDTKAFFEAVCMLAFADTADHISLGEFARTIIRANPFKGGTSEFAYPDEGGYDSISQVLGDYILEQNGIIETNQSVKKVVIENSKAIGVITGNEKFYPADCVVISYPAYMALNQLFDDGVIDRKFIEKINRLDKKTAVVEVHFALNSKIDNKQVVFPVGNHYTTKGIFFISNITPTVSPHGEHLIIAGTPVNPSVADNSEKIRDIVSTMKKEISSIYPNFTSSLLWERPMAWKLVESVVKEPGMVWKSKMPHQIPDIEGLFFVGDSTISYGIGTDSAAHSSILCYPKIESFLKT